VDPVAGGRLWLRDTRHTITNRGERAGGTWVAAWHQAPVRFVCIMSVCRGAFLKSNLSPYYETQTYEEVKQMNVLLAARVNIGSSKK
jgi:hypothetical protein